MKFTLSWLKDYLESDASAEEIAAKLTSIGLEVEAVDKREAWQAFIVAEIVAAAKHPNADKLQILSVNIGQARPVRVVCGAPNARKGLIGVFAPPGAYIPGLDLVLGVSKIRDVESFGMMCSERELLLSDEHKGIIDLDAASLAQAKAEIGASFAAYKGLDDPIFDVSLTPNRADCACVYGIARDLAAAGLGRLKTVKILPLPAARAGNTASSAARAGNEPPAAKGAEITPPQLKVEDTENCLGFAALRVENIENRAAPEWLRARLRAIGVAPKNALVDISAYMSFDVGRPLHIFDANKVRGALHIRRAKSGEKLAALNGKTYDVPEGCCVIADESGVIALPGLIGGERTACSAQTKNALIESALWKPEFVARLGRELGIATDARYRFERGVDPDFVLPGLALCAERVQKWCGTPKTRFSACAQAAMRAGGRRDIVFPLGEIRRLTGIDVPEDKAAALLAALGFGVKKQRGKAGAPAALLVCAPSWRADIAGKADLVEEIIRLYGIDKITPQALPHYYGREARLLTALQSRSRLVRRALAARAMAEAVTYSFISAAAAQLFGGGQAELKLQNPIAADMSDMRPSLLPSLLAAARRNADRGYADVALFEVGDVYHSAAPAGQKRAAAGVRAGSAGPAGAGRLWSGSAAAVDCFAAKADALAALEALGLAADKVQAERGAPSYFHPGRSGLIKLGPKNILGAFGELHPQAAEFFGLRGAVCAFELYLEAIPAGRKKSVKTKPALALSPFQSVKRDFSFIVDEDIAAAAVLRAAAGADKKQISEARIFDVFGGEGIEAGKKAIGVEVVIQPRERSLTDAELEALSAKLIDNVLKSTKGALR